MAEIGRLADQSRSAGVEVELKVEGEPGDLPPGVDLSAFRIAQEGLTNVLKHGGRVARVLVRYSPGAVAVEIADDGRAGAAAEADGTGHGLIGMRERVAVFGGDLTAGPVPGGGYRLAARLPYAAAARDRGGPAVIRVLVADDQALVRAGFSVLIDTDPGLEVVGEASNGAEAVELARATRPDVVLMDIRMPVMDGLEATRQILALDGADTIRVLMLTTFDLDEYVFGALKAGASGFLLKGTPPADLLAGIATVAAGEALLSPSVTRQLIEEHVRRPQAVPPAGHTLEGLTDRELEVLTLVARGLSNAEIAEQLYVSPATAKTHVARLLMKLGARDRAQLIVVAYESGLVTPGPRPS